MKISEGKRVVMEYELSVAGGDVIETSTNKGPLAYIHGSGQMLPGLEKRLEGLEAGAAEDGVIPASEAYGTEESLPTTTLGKGDFPAGEEVDVGKTFQAADKSGNPLSFTVVEIDGEKVKVRFNHPLAGKDIEFSVKILEVGEPN